MVYVFQSGAVPDGEVSGRTFDCGILEPANFDRRKISFERIYPTMMPGIGPVGAAFESGFRVSTEYLPAKIRFDDEHSPTDFHYVEGLQFVSAAARELIEKFEPGVHQFEPVEYVRSNGDHVEHRFVMFICRRLDSVDRAHTNMILYDDLRWLPAKSVMGYDPKLVPLGTDLDEKPVKVFSLTRIGDAHMWRDIYIAGEQYMSSTLIEAIESSRLTGLDYLPEQFVP